MNAAQQKPDAALVLAKLKDFQLRTAQMVFHRLYTDADRVDRFLVADEVGLGKTFVAKAVIAQALVHLWDSAKRLDVVYICSNADIARQNVDRLKRDLTDGGFSDVTRLTLLPLYAKGLSSQKVNFISLTPGTSLDIRGSQGAWRERALLYTILVKAWGISHVGARNLLQGYVQNGNWWRSQLKGFLERYNNRDEALIEQIAETFRKNKELREKYKSLAECCRGGVRKKDNQACRDLIGELRRSLAEECLNRLDPALVILDEFQRFRHLLQDNDEISSLAQQLFEKADSDRNNHVRILLLSATPYKMYTRPDDGNNDHYADFLLTLGFLVRDKVKVEAFKRALSDFRESLVDGEAALDRLRIARTAIEDTLRRVMCRTERLGVTKNRNGMVKEVLSATLALDPDDVEAFRALDLTGHAVDIADTVEIWKSAAFSLDLMDNHYQLKKRILKRLPGDKAIRAALQSSPHALLPAHSIERYEPLPIHNARTRDIVGQCLDSGAWRLLWIPPSLSYWEPRGAYAEKSLQSFTKRLLFSSWLVAPKAIAGVLSYEAERRMIAAHDNPPPYSKLRESVGQLLRFTESDGRLTGLPLFALFYPSPTWATIVDPLELSLAHGDMSNAEAALAETEARIREVLTAHLSKAPTTGQVDQSWYWAAPLLLDRVSFPVVQEWVKGVDDEGEQDEWAWETFVDSKGDDSLFARHIDELRAVLNNSRSLGRPPDDLIQVLAKVALASPAVLTLRSLLRVSGDGVPTREHLGAAAWAALGFRTLFNLAETQILLRAGNDDERYWERVLDEGINGNLQAVLDEYVHMISEALGGAGQKPEDAYAIAEELEAAVSLRTAVIEYDDFESLISTNSKELLTGSIRCRFALRFGDSKTADDEDLRPTSVRAAFNSPFRPFVLASTSVGQEGLDFHPYCHAIVHWNLPSNPVDFEQREGRIHRFKAHFVRKNLAAYYGLAGMAKISAHPLRDPWARIFARAVADRPEDSSDIVPYWQVDGEHCIERHIPMLPLSRDQQRYEDLMSALALYRLVFGQPRQDELLHLVAERWDTSNVERLLAERIDLQPRN
jgi:hypothetical protein